MWSSRSYSKELECCHVMSMCMFMSLTHSHTHTCTLPGWGDEGGESSGWKWLMPLFVHPGIWSTSALLGPGQIWYPLQGLKLPFVLSPEDPGKDPPPPNPTHPRVAQSGPTSELGTLSGDDIYDVEMACYLFSGQTHRLLSLTLFLSLSLSLSFHPLFF